MSSSEWKTERLQNLCSLITDGKHGDCANQDNSGYYFLSAKDVSDGKLYYGNARQITKEDFLDTHKRTRLEPFDILLTNSGTIGRMAIAPNNELTSRTTFQKSVAILKPIQEKVVPHFLYYCLLARKSDIVNTASGTTQQNLLLGDLRSFEIQVPESVETQRRIADILSALDEKIELNRQTNATLEAIAQAIFKEWFVDFNFPGSAALTTGGATGELTESELGPIPSGWRIGKIADLCDVNKNVITKKDKFEWVDYIEISEVSRGRVGNIARYNYEDAPSRARRKLQHGDIVLSTVRPNRGSFFLALDPPQNLIVSTGFAVFSPDKAPFSFLYLFLTDDEKLEFYGHVADGGAYPAINPNLIMEMDLVTPDDSLLDQFHSITEPILLSIAQNEQEAKSLAEIRDALLPKLMNGEIEL